MPLLHVKRRAPSWRVLMLYDVPRWALALKTRHLQRFIHPDFEIEGVLDSEVTPAQLARADLVTVYFWQQIGLNRALLAACEQVCDKLLVGICAHDLMEGKWREPGLSLMRRLARGVFVVNRLLEQEYTPLFDVPVFYTPNGVDTRFFRRPLFRRKTLGPMRVGWAGSLTNHGPDQRGFHDVIEPAVNATEGVELVTAAREDRWRTPLEMRKFYHSLDVYLCASRSEGTPNPCMEALACGVPIVSARVGCMPELIRDGYNGLLVTPDVASFSEHLAYLRDHPRERECMRRGARASVRTWDWRTTSRCYETMFRAVLQTEAR